MECITHRVWQALTATDNRDAWQKRWDLKTNEQEDIIGSDAVARVTDG